MSTLIHERVAMCQQGTNPKTICRVASGWVVMGDVQFLRGYSLLLPDPVVVDLNAMDRERRAQYLMDMSAVGDAVLSVTDAYRINYEILGNVEPALHAHVFPRYRNEDVELILRPVWFYDWDNAPAFELSRDASLMEEIRSELEKNGVVA